jgi:molybdenum cofactor cytidylyltransferase
MGRQTDQSGRQSVERADNRPGADGDTLVGGVLLAAGRGERFADGNKLLAAIDGTPVVRRAARSLLASSLAEVAVVLGHQHETVRDVLSDLDIATSVNEDYAAGQSRSVATGVATARKRGWDGAVFALGDMPFVDPESVDALVDAYERNRGTVLAPAYDGTRGNPVLFDRRYFDALSDLTGDRGGRQIVRQEGTLVPVDDPGVRQDVDRVTDLDPDA